MEPQPVYEVKGIIPKLVTEAAKQSKQPITMNQPQNITHSEIQLKDIFVRFINDSFFEKAENKGKKFVIDNTNVHAIRECFDWAQEKHTTKGILLVGDYGIGKSVIVEGLFKFYTWLHYRTCAYKPIYRTANKIASFFREGDEFNISVCKTCCILFIPEIGREPLGSEGKGKPIEEVISERYDGKRTIVTSCNEFKDLPYGDYIYERLNHMCKVIEMRGDSKR
jgi:DNA replication protein DnaC